MDCWQGKPVLKINLPYIHLQTPVISCQCTLIHSKGSTNKNLSHLCLQGWVVALNWRITLKSAEQIFPQGQQSEPWTKENWFPVKAGISGWRSWQPRTSHLDCSPLLQFFSFLHDLDTSDLFKGFVQTCWAIFSMRKSSWLLEKVNGEKNINPFWVNDQFVIEPPKNCCFSHALPRVNQIIFP